MTMETFMGTHPHDRSERSCFGLAVGRALERRHPVHTAKMVARTLSDQGPECTIRTAENILHGHLSARTITRLLDAYGIGLFLQAAGIRAGGLDVEDVLEDFIIENAERAKKERDAWEEKIVGYQTKLGRLRDHTSSATGADRSMADRMG
jgi:hypothetical protein